MFVLLRNTCIFSDRMDIRRERQNWVEGTSRLGSVNITYLLLRSLLFLT